jgi:methylated-DNA-protein-cysteine methyltransferase-like protein
MAVREKYVTPESYLLLDIGGEITDVAIITKGVLKASLSFPFGKRTFFKYMCTKLEIEQRDAEELFKLWSAGTLAEKKKKKVEPLFQSIENSWGEAFRACIGTLPHTLTLPSTIFLTADADIRGWFVDVVRNEPFIQSMVAVYVGVPRGARQVGWTLKRIEESIRLPWWRVINNEGRITIKGNMYNTPDIQKQLLEAEGIKVTDDLTLDIKKYRYKANRDQLKKWGLSDTYRGMVLEKYGL